MDKFFPSLQYQDHPAFADLDTSPYPSDLEQEIDAAVSGFNNGFDRMLAEAKSPTARLELLKQQYIAEPIAKIMKLVGSRSPGFPLFDGFLEVLQHRLIENLELELLIADRQGRYHFRPMTAECEHIFQSLRREGFYAGTISPSVIDGLWELLAPAQEKIMANAREGHIDRRSLVTAQVGQDACDLLGQVLNSPEVINAVSNFLLMDMYYSGYQIELSVPGTVWWRERYGQTDYESTKTSYWHLDQATDSIKSIIYMSNVNEENGPFAVIPSAWPVGPNYFSSSASRIMDGIANSYHYPDLIHLPPDDRYLLKSPVGRQHFLYLPPVMRLVSHWGNDVVTGSALEAEVVQREKKFISPECNFILFHGAKLYHRGGMVKSGHRWALQSVFNRIH